MSWVTPTSGQRMIGAEMRREPSEDLVRLMERPTMSSGSSTPSTHLKYSDHSLVELIHLGVDADKKHIFFVTDVATK